MKDVFELVNLIIEECNLYCYDKVVDDAAQIYGVERAILKRVEKSLYLTPKMLEFLENKLNIKRDGKQEES